MKTLILGIDPGPVKTAWVLLDDQTIVRKEIEENLKCIDSLVSLRVKSNQKLHIAIEMIASYGMPVGAEVFTTCVWIGRYLQALGLAQLVYRYEIKQHLCNSMQAKDPHIRQALIDRFGQTKERAIGKKKTPGPLYGISKDMWSALAVAVTVQDKLKNQPHGGIKNKLIYSELS